MKIKKIKKYIYKNRLIMREREREGEREGGRERTQNFITQGLRF